MSGIVCPFCLDDGFDLVGLRHHLMAGYCEVFDHTETLEEERERRAKEAP